MWSTYVTMEFTLDKSIWHLWLMGLSVEQAVHYVRQKMPTPTDSVLLKSFVLSQYRNYELLEHHLHRPKHLMSQLLFPLPKETKQFLIESYYSFDGRVLREVLGKKLSSRIRKELDEAREKSGIPVAGCKRMFDNFKRISKRVEDLDGDIVKIIQADFLLPAQLASQYAHIVFINFYRLDTSKKRLASLQFADFEFIGSVIMQHFTTTATSAIPEIDVAFAQDCHNLKTLLLNHRDIIDELRTSIVATVSESRRTSITTNASSFSGATTPLDKLCNSTQLRTIFKNVLAIGSGLSSGKELRDIFSTVVEKVSDPLAAMGCTAADATAVFEAAAAKFPEVNSLNANYRRRYLSSFSRLMKAVGLCCQRLLPGGSGGKI
ncbi:acidic fibroblast growth factor binding protein [Zopfochytrium polystomum]|nr:acidic fibroblast growth factor binding protein [Zopfochytrium polystomum]